VSCLKADIARSGSYKCNAVAVAVQDWKNQSKEIAESFFTLHNAEIYSMHITQLCSTNTLSSPACQSLVSDISSSFALACEVQQVACLATARIHELMPPTYLQLEKIIVLDERIQLPYRLSQSVQIFLLIMAGSAQYVRVCSKGHVLGSALMALCTTISAAPADLRVHVQLRTQNVSRRSVLC
jgi:hypothetical protein